MYDEAADLSAHVREIDDMDAALSHGGLVVDWPKARVCDVGGGGGLRAALLSTRARRTYCADVIDQQARYGGEFVKLLAEKLLRHGQRMAIDRFEIHVTDAMCLMYRDDWFDFICSVNAFEHIPDPSAALREMARVLKPGGVAYISFDPIWTADTGSHFSYRIPEPWAHLVLSDDEFTGRLRDIGAEQWEIDDFLRAMNRVRLGRYEELFSTEATRLGLAIGFRNRWSGVERPEHAMHANLEKALESYSRDELFTRGMAFAMRKEY